MIVAVDIDDTILSLVDIWLKKYNADYDDHLEKNNITDWDIGKFVKKECGDKIYRYIENPSIYFETPPIKGAKTGIEKIRDMGHRVIFMTASSVQDAKLGWLKTNKFLKDRGDYVVSHDKNLIKFDIIVDDRYDNVKNKNGILFNQPWNEKYEYPVRANNWDEVCEEIVRFTTNQKGCWH